MTERRERQRERLKDEREGEEREVIEGREEREKVGLMTFRHPEWEEDF